MNGFLTLWFVARAPCARPAPPPTAGIAEKPRALGDRYNRPGYATAQIKYPLNLTLGKLFLEKTTSDVILKIGAIAGTHALAATRSGQMKTLENNWRQKSIENLEKDFWGQPPKDSTPLVDKVHRLRTIQIEKLEPKDIRLLIGQNVGLRFLIPVALDILSDDIFTDTDFYNGDLLQNVLQVDKDFWNENKDLKDKLDGLLDSYSDEDKEKFRKGKFDEWT